MRPAFLTAARDAAEGWTFEAPYTEPQSAGTKASKAFTTAYRKRYGLAPARWAAEAYDAVGLIARALDALGAARKSNPARSPNASSAPPTTAWPSRSTSPRTPPTR